MTEKEFKSGQNVRSEIHGLGRVEADLGQTVIIRFGVTIHECLKTELTLVYTPIEAFDNGKWHSPLEVVLRSQAEAICSINNAWGVFARSRIELLPHQLWVCRQVLHEWPARWLVADDVGLGKTIEAGLILTALLSRERIHRLLIICPASLVEQWQYRLRTMFDIRSMIYTPGADTDRSDFWNITPQVIASLQTLRKDSKKRHERLLKSNPWDLVLVDEAHHLNADEDTGPTLGHRLLTKLVENKRINSMVFFTGTPHRGKPFGFFALLSLLRPDLFNPHKDTVSQLRDLPRIMIRNNKQNVTDIHGKPIFKEPEIQSRTYEYSPNEAHFYDMLTEFIITGKAYASSLTSNDARAVMLVLISMQKLASSSIAAIRRAFKGRLSRLTETSYKIRDLKQLHVALKQTEEAEKNYDQDFLSNVEEQIAELSAELRLMEHERERLEELIRAADGVEEETKINAIIDEVAHYDPECAVLFFTEYKATQSLLMSSLIKRFGGNCVTFINGDEEASEVIGLDGKMHTIKQRREEAAHIFNEGTIRFLVSTEAGGEGIDLQHNCYTLIHADLPWNPMRLHQRVGRLNRYGQKKRVCVTYFRNPHTVEARIWDKLNEKIEHINLALRQVMAQPEDMMQLVLGMTSHSMFREIFSEGNLVPPESFDTWFDNKTASFGGQDVIDTVKELVGNCSKFEFREVSNKLPRVDLPDLRAFFVGMLQLNRRRVQENEQGISFKTPEEWLVEPAILPSYQDMLFDRARITENSTEFLLGVGHRLIDRAVDQARNLTSCITILPKDALDGMLCIFRIYDRVTSGSKIHSPVICGIQNDSNGSAEVLNDWKLLKKLNHILSTRLSRDEPTEAVEQSNKFLQTISKAEIMCKEHIVNSDIDFLCPEVELLAVINNQT